MQPVSKTDHQLGADFLRQFHELTQGRFDLAYPRPAGAHNWNVHSIAQNVGPHNGIVGGKAIPTGELPSLQVAVVPPDRAPRIVQPAKGRGILNFEALRRDYYDFVDSV